MFFLTLLQIFPFFLGADARHAVLDNSHLVIEIQNNDYPLLDQATIDFFLSQKATAMVYDRNASFEMPDNIPQEIETLLVRYSVKYSLPLDVVVRLSEVESNHGVHKQSVKPNYDGSVDIGVLALNSSYLDYFAHRYYEGSPSEFDPYNNEHNIQTGLAYLAHLNNLTGDISSAIIAYNCGYQSMKRGNIPLSTQRYAKAILYGEPL